MFTCQDSEGFSVSKDKPISRDLLDFAGDLLKASAKDIALIMVDNAVEEWTTEVEDALTVHHHNDSQIWAVSCKPGATSRCRKNRGTVSEVKHK